MRRCPAGGPWPRSQSDVQGSGGARPRWGARGRPEACSRLVSLAGRMYEPRGPAHWSRLHVRSGGRAPLAAEPHYKYGRAFHRPCNCRDTRTSERSSSQPKAADGLRESAVLELKSAINKQNVVRAVAGLANADGGLILVGVLEHAVGDDRLVGVPPQQLDGLATQLRTLLEPPVEPEVIVVTVPGGEGRVIGVLRVDPDDVDRPVVLNGQVFVRGLGATLPARRRQLLQLISEDASRDIGFGMPGTIPLSVDSSQLWLNAPTDPAPELEIRLRARMRLAPTSANRAVLDSVAKQRVLTAVQTSAAPTLARLSVGRELRAESWNYTRARTDQLNARASLASDRGKPEKDRLQAGVGGRLILQRFGRNIDLLIGVGVSPWRDGTETVLKDAQSGVEDFPEGQPRRLELRDLFEVLLGLRLVASTVLAAAAGIDGDLGRQTQTSAAITAKRGDLEELINVGPYPRDDCDVQLPRYTFKTVIPEREDFVQSIEALTVEWWLSHLLLDLGARDFEDDLILLAAR